MSSSGYAILEQPKYETIKIVVQSVSKTIDYKVDLKFFCRLLRKLLFSYIVYIHTYLR